MQVDFYQLGSTPLEQVIASIAQKLLGEGKRLLVVAEDQGPATLNREDLVEVGDRRHLVVAERDLEGDRGLAPVRGKGGEGELHPREPLEVDRVHDAAVLDQTDRTAVAGEAQAEHSHAFPFCVPPVPPKRAS